MAVEGIVGWAGPNKRGDGFRVAIGETWYTTLKRHEGVLEKGNKVAVITAEVDGETHITKVKLLAKGESKSWGGGKGGGGGRKPNPEAEKRYAKQAEREEARWTHQLETVEPRITHANSRDHALRYLDLLVRTEALVLGKDSAKKEAVLTNKLNELIALFVAQANAAGGVVAADADDDFESDEAADDSIKSDEDFDDDDFEE